MALHHFEFDRVPFLKGFKSVRLNRGVMNEDIRPAITADETVTLGIIEPLYLALNFCHLHPPVEFGNNELELRTCSQQRAPGASV